MSRTNPNGSRREPPLTPGAVEPIDPSTRFEPHDVDITKVIGTLLAIVLGTLITCVVVYPFFSILRREHVAAPQPIARPVPPGPRLQVNPAQDLRQMRAAENDALTSYRWVDRGAGVVSIPIDDAIRIVAQRGIPPAPSADAKYFPPSAGSLQTGFEQREETLR